MKGEIGAWARKAFLDYWERWNSVREDDCDDYIDDPAAPAALRKYLAFARAPAHGQLLPKPHPRLFADYEGTRVRVTMASRFGDVGITTDLDAELGYQQRVLVRQLSNFSEVP
ncbi:MAG TPA: hypothetical protein VLE97_11380 [Gaiellaceae bacterium]|nr:hypothetical protein [Gaiellaceae bacterium]